MGFGSRRGPLHPMLATRAHSCPQSRRASKKRRRRRRRRSCTFVKIWTLTWQVGKNMLSAIRIGDKLQSCRRSQSHKAPATLDVYGVCAQQKGSSFAGGYWQGHLNEHRGSYKRPGPLYMCTSTYTMNRKPRRSSGILSSKIPRRPSILTLYSHCLIQTSNHIKPHNLPM